MAVSNRQDVFKLMGECVFEYLLILGMYVFYLEGIN